MGRPSNRSPSAAKIERIKKTAARPILTYWHAFYLCSLADNRALVFVRSEDGSIVAPSLRRHEAPTKPFAWLLVWLRPNLTAEPSRSLEPATPPWVISKTPQF